MVIPVSCVFNGCSNPPLGDGETKCGFHRHRRQCQVPNCCNQVYARQLCVRHGGKRICATEGCLRNARIALFCAQHARTPVRTEICSVDGCPRVAHLRHRCVRHGGGRQCKVASCKTHARRGGYCWRHRVMSDEGPALGDDFGSSTSGTDDDATLTATETTLELADPSNDPFLVSGPTIMRYLDEIDLAELVSYS
ncbi:hypothetical protein ACHHYP_10236 [Achlya hypogyna]|uniref:WRKY transcription factor 19 n=1 Tax=Achlya hypogyna TaxID=1202772 RepID=A0A1V9YLU6_ACHHY|nr:hypothetical protein ACHHYP_10236 [Achlya hypogyna]